MLIVHMIWIQGSDGFIWLADAWESDTISENPSGWQEALAKAAADAQSNGGTSRVQIVKVPGVEDLFGIPEVTAQAPAERLSVLLSHSVDCAREANPSPEEMVTFGAYLSQIGEALR